MAHERSKDNVYAVILVGGKGKRLRPLSSSACPKAFLSITSDRKTMFRRTLDRIKRIVPEKNILVVANRIHAKLVKKDFPCILDGNLILEPISRNTAPAITLAAFVLKNRCDDAVMLVTPTDQYIGENRKFIEAAKAGIGFVQDSSRDFLVAIAVQPRYPATDFGYIALHSSMPVAKDAGIYGVKAFVEKPDAELANEYFNSGRFLWNTGAFIFKTDAILRAVKACEPGIYHGLKALDIEGSYYRLPDISIDYAVMEKVSNLYCVKGDYFWQDMGSFDSLRVILRKESRKFIMKGGKITSIL